jgi:hypothetical protein
VSVGLEYQAFAYEAYGRYEAQNGTPVKRQVNAWTRQTVVCLALNSALLLKVSLRPQVSLRPGVPRLERVLQPIDPRRAFFNCERGAF